MQEADIPRAVEDARKGRQEFRLDRTGVIHAIFGKVSFDDDKLKENLAALMESIVARSHRIKGQYIPLRRDDHRDGSAPIKLDVGAVQSLRTN